MRAGLNMAKSSKPTWSQIKARIKHWDKAQLTGLIQDLFGHSQDNRDFLAARLLRDSIGEQVLAPYLKRIESAFYNKKGWPANRLNLKDARSAIREYQRATSDPAGTLELMLVHVETGTQFTREFGDIDEGFYDSLCTHATRDQEDVVKQGRPAVVPASAGPAVRNWPGRPTASAGDMVITWWTWLARSPPSTRTKVNSRRDDGAVPDVAIGLEPILITRNSDP